MMRPRVYWSGLLAAILLRAHAALALATLKDARPADAVQRLSHLFTDISESVRKVGEDAEVVFVQLYKFDQHLEANLVHEIGMLNSTGERLSELQDRYRTETNKSVRELQRLETTLRKSQATDAHFKTTASHAGKAFDRFHEKVVRTVSSLQRVMAASKSTSRDHVVSTVTIPKALVTDLRGLLATKFNKDSQKDLRKRFEDVFAAFTTEAAPQALTPALVGRTVALLQSLVATAKQGRVGFLVQLQSRRQRLAGTAAEASSKADAARTVLSEDVRNAGELAFSVGFASTAEGIDADFLKKVREHMKVKAELVIRLRNTRSAQLTTLKELEDLLNGRHGAQPTSLSFLQRNSVHPVAHRVNNFSTLQTEIEAALRQKADTHSILMRVKVALAPAPSIDVGGVREVVSTMGSALRAVDSVQTSAEDAKRACAAQRFAVGEKQRRLRGTLSLAAASQNHTNAAIHAARRNLDGIASKVQALNRSALELASASSRMNKVLERQRRDRATIKAAVSKAKDVARSSLDSATGRATIALIERLLGQLHSEETTDRAYQAQQAALEKDDVEYTRDYSQLLTDRRLHYQASLSALELYASELVGDASAKDATLSEDAELQQVGQELCDSILTFYKKHSARREHLSGVLRTVLPKVPEVLGLGSVSDGDTIDAP